MKLQTLMYKIFGINEERNNTMEKATLMTDKAEKYSRRFCRWMTIYYSLPDDHPRKDEIYWKMMIAQQRYKSASQLAINLMAKL